MQDCTGLWTMGDQEMPDQAIHADAEAIGLVHRMLGDEEAGWNIGTFGAIAEFHHVEGDPPPVPVLTPDGGEVVTARGALRIELQPDVRSVAYEGLSKRPDAWTQGIAFALPADRARMTGRTVLTEVGEDVWALREQDRSAILFDLGLGAPHVDFCVRVAEPGLLRDLRGCLGRSVLDPANPAMAAIKDAHPHRVCRSLLGRVEVFQRIGSTSKGIPSPVGPHTHVLPGLLGKRRTHSANTPIPDGWVPVLSLHPGNAVTDRLGRPRAFDMAAFDAFQQLVVAFGPPGYAAEKRRVREAVKAGIDPRSFVPAASRENRRAARVCLRQMLHTDSNIQNLGVWLDVFDRGRGACDADDEDA